MASTLQRLLRLPAVAWIWVSTVILSLNAPDLVTGSEHERLPLVAMTAWIWAGVASGYVLLLPVVQRRASDVVGAVAAIWVFVAVATISGPVLETGSDPTELPLLGVLAPIGGAIATGFVALNAARKSSEIEPDREQVSPRRRAVTV